MGAVFSVPLAQVTHAAELPGPTVALVAGRGTPLDRLSLRTATLLIGSEREGLPDELVQAADHVAQIPIASHSLNAAMAATVALYEASRMARG
jgi:TrmH family RNA methyltransferase